MRIREALTGAVLPAAMLAIAAGAGAADRPYVRSGDLPHLLIDRPQPAAFRTDTIEFQLAPAKSPGWRLEYKVSMKAADALVYSLTASDPVISEFHNEMLPSKAVMFYREEQATTASHGQFVSPADGEHGWYLANTTDKPVTVQLKLSGYYTVAPGLISFKN